MDSAYIDDFMMYVFKTYRCPVGQGHDLGGCPYFHPGADDRRRSPRSYTYSYRKCQHFERRATRCPRGDLCHYAHGEFEAGFHPSRYRTQICSYGAQCSRNTCFFAHTQAEIRLVPPPACTLPTPSFPPLYRNAADERSLSDVYPPGGMQPPTSQMWQQQQQLLNGPSFTPMVVTRAAPTSQMQQQQQQQHGPSFRSLFQH